MVFFLDCFGYLMVPIVVKFGEGKIFPKNASAKIAGHLDCSCTQQHTQQHLSTRHESMQGFHVFWRCFWGYSPPKKMNMSHEQIEKGCFFLRGFHCSYWLFRRDVFVFWKNINSRNPDSRIAILRTPKTHCYTASGPFPNWMVLEDS